MKNKERGMEERREGEINYVGVKHCIKENNIKVYH